MSKSQEPETRTVERSDGSLRVTIPADICADLGLDAGDELRVGCFTDGSVGFYPEDVPFPASLDRYVGNTTIVDHNGSLKPVIRKPAPRRVGIAVRDDLRFRVVGGAVHAKQDR